MADGDCVVGPDVVVIEWRGDLWYADGLPLVKDLSLCKIMPSPHDRRLVLSVGIVKPPKATPKPPTTEVISDPEPIVVVPPHEPPILTPEVIEVIEETLVEKAVDMLGDNPLAVVMAVSFAVFKKLLDGKQAKAQEEADQKCSGRHGHAESQVKELESQVADLTKQLSEMASNLEWERPNYASKSDLKRLQEAVKELQKRGDQDDENN